MHSQSSPQIDYTQAIAAIVATMPDERKAQVYEYVLFLQARARVAKGGQAQVEADEAWWDAQFAATDEARLAAFIASAMAEGESSGIAIRD
ncbi:MAG: hypothetical protein M1546_20335 [Chloroflexi bacterium]|nr:hypothetical protein [Chloroflexota bacterium]